MCICLLNNFNARPCLGWGYACFLLLEPVPDPRDSGCMTHLQQHL